MRTNLLNNLSKGMNFSLTRILERVYNRYAATLLVLLVVGFGQMWGTSVIMDFASSSTTGPTTIDKQGNFYKLNGISISTGSTKSIDASSSATVNGISWTGRNGNKSTYYIVMDGEDAISKFVFYFYVSNKDATATFTLKDGSSASATLPRSAVGAKDQADSIIVTGSFSQGTIYKLVMSSNEKLYGVRVEYGSASTPRTFKSGEKIYFKDAWYTAGNSSKWKTGDGDLCAQFYDDAATPNTAWVTCGTNVAGGWNNDNSVYEITVPQLAGVDHVFTGVIFARGKAGFSSLTTNCWNRTSNQEPEEYKNLFTVNNTADGSGFYGGAWSKYGHPAALVGDFNNWDPSANVFGDFNSNIGATFIDLEASTDYGFKVLQGESYCGNTGTITGDISGWHFDKDANCTITSGEAGEYMFKWNKETYYITEVKYPKNRLTKNTYLYVDARNTNWAAASFAARYFYKYYDNGGDLPSGGTVTCTTPIESHVHYTLVPDNDYVGQVQVERKDPTNVDGDRWNYAATANANTRTSVKQNCLLTSNATGGTWDNFAMVWGTYCPPMSSASLSDNSTALVSWQTGTGAEDNPYLVAASGTIKVIASAIKAVNDANMTPMYDFKVSDNGGDASSAQSGTGKTYDKGSLSTGHTYEISLDAWNSYNETNGTKNTSATHKWYKAVTLRNVTHTLAGVTLSSGESGTGAAADNEPYTATFAAATGYDLPATITVKFGTTTKTAGTDYTWNQATGVVSIFANKIDNNVTIKIDGVAQTYTITYKDYKDGGNTDFSGVHIGSQPTTHTYNKATTLKSASKSGYVFGGWYDNPSCTGSAITEIGKTAKTADFTLYAKWTAMSMVDLESGTLYTASNMVPNGVSLTSSYQYYPGVSADQRFNIIGTGAGSSPTGPMGAKNESNTFGGTAFSTVMGFDKDASPTDAVPAHHALQFKIPAAGQLEIWFNNNGNIFLSNGTTEYTVDAAYKILTVTAGTWYLYAKAGSKKLGGIRYKPTHSVTAATSTGDDTKGTVSAAKTTLAEDSSTVITAVPATGYQVTNWAKSGTGASISPSGSSSSLTTTLTMGTADATVTVTFGAINYSVTYSEPDNGDYTIQVESGDADNSTQTANYGNTITLAATPGEGYEFDSWTITKTSDGSDVTDDVSLSDETDKDATFTMPAYGVTVTATFVESITLYTVTYNANGGSCSPSSATQASEGGSLTLPTPTRDGYTCSGWYTNSSGGTKRGNAGGSYTPTSDETLYAQWTKVYASGTYQFDGHLTVGTSPSKTVTTSETSYSAFRVDNLFFSATTIQFEGTDGTPQGDGDNYKGWKMKTNGSTIKFFVEDDSDVEVSIGGIGSSSSCKISYTDQSSVAQDNVSISAGSHPIYEVKAGTMVTIAFTVDEGNKKSVTLKRIAISGTATYTISYNCDDADSGCPSEAASQSTLPNPLPSAPTKDGYTFVGWFTDSEKTEAAVAGATLSEDVTLYAKWGTSRTIAWYVDGSTYSTGSPTTTTCEELGITTMPTAPSALSCSDVFRGWSTTNLEGNATNTTPSDLFTIAGDAPTIDANKTFYAVFANNAAVDATSFTSTFTSKAWADADSKWTSGKDGYAKSATQGVQISTGVTGANATTKAEYKAVSKVVVTYSTNSGSGAGSIEIKVGGTTMSGDADVTKTGGTDDRTINYIPASSLDGKVKITVNTTDGSIYIKSVQIFHSGSFVNYRCVCPSVTVTPKLVTSGTPIFITSAAGKTVRSQDTLHISGSGFASSTTLTLKNLSPKFVLKSATNGAISTDATGSIDTDAFIFYNPGATTEDGLDKNSSFTITDGKADVEVETALIGRHLPENFVIAAKSGDAWYALPADMANTTPTPVEITVDNATTPTTGTAIYDNAYSLYGQHNTSVSAGNGQYVKLAMRGQSNAPLLGSATGSSTLGKSGTAGVTSDIGKQYWWLFKQTNTSITNAADAKYIVYSANNTTNHLKLWMAAGGTGNPKWGLYANGIEEIRLIPWVEKVFSITYNLNSGTNPVGAPTGFTTRSEDIDLPTPTRDDYVFQGWYTDEEFTSDRVYIIPSGSTGDKTYYAKWGAEVSVAWTVTKVDGKLYKGGGGHTVTAIVDDASWTGSASSLVLGASDGVILGTATTSTVDSKAQIEATFDITEDVEGDEIIFYLTAPANGSYGAIEDNEEVSLDACPSGGGGSGTSLYKFQVKTGLGSGSSNIDKSVTAATTDNYLSVLEGGTLPMSLSSNGNIQTKSDSALCFNSTSGILKPTLTSPKKIQVGDFVKYRSTSQTISMMKTTSYDVNTDVILPAGNKMAVTSYSMKDLTVLNLTKNGSSPEIKYFEIIRPSEVLFFAEVKTGLTAGNLGATTDEIEQTTSTVLEYITGGKLYTKARNVGYVKQTTNEIQLTDGASGTYIKLSLNEALAAGDIILINTTNPSYLLGITTDATYPSSSPITSPYTIPAESGMIGKKDIYLWKSGSNTNLRTVAVVRLGSGTGVATSLSWSGSLADEATVDKNDVDADFTYSASADNNSIGAITYRSSDESVATVDSEGEVHIVGDGSTTITATIAACGCYNGNSISYSLNVANTCADVRGTVTAEDLGCEGTQLTLSGYTDGATIQWYKDGVSLGGSYINATCTVTDAGEYYAVTHKACDMVSNSITIEAADDDINPTIFADEFSIKDGRWFGYRLMQLEEGQSVSVKTVPTGWTDSDYEITTGADNIVRIKGKVDVASAANKTLTLTVSDNCSGSEDFDITIHETVATAKKTVAWIATGTKGEKTCKASESSNTDLYQALETAGYDLTAYNAYWTVEEKELVKEYSQYDLIILTDYPDSQKGPISDKNRSQSYTNALGLLIDHKPILTFEAFVAGCPNWGIESNPKDTKTTQTDLTLLCNAGDIFEDPSGKFAAGAAIKVTSASSGQALQGFPIATSPDFVFIGKITDSDSKEYVACCERQVEIAARMMVFGLNHAIMDNITADGKLMVAGFLNYLYQTDAADIPDCSVIFTGEGADANWNTAGNWESGSVPDDPYVSVRIDAPCVIPDSYVAKAGHVKIHVGVNDGFEAFNGSLTIAPTGELIVEKTVSRVEDNEYTVHKETQVGDIYLQSGASGTGALIMKSYRGGNDATVEFYSLGRKNGSGKKIYQYMGTPFDLSEVQYNYYGAWMYRWDVVNQTWIKMKNGNPASTFLGYCISNPTTADHYTYWMQGELVSTADKTLNMTYNGSRTENLLANSWTAPISINALNDGATFTNCEKTIYIFNAGSDAEYEAHASDAASATATSAGSYITLPISSTPYVGSELKVIPSMQAFSVYATGANPSLTLDYAKLVHAPAVAESAAIVGARAPRQSNAATDDPIVLRLRVNGDRFSDIVYMLEREDFTEGFDNGWDGRKMEGLEETPTLYAISTDGNMAVNCVPEMEGTMLGFKAGEDENYTFTFGYPEEEDDIYLLDVQTGLYTRIVDGNNYSFATSDKIADNRFILTRNAPGVATGVENAQGGDNLRDKALKFIYQDKMYIFIRGVLYDSGGRRVGEKMPYDDATEKGGAL